MLPTVKNADLEAWRRWKKSGSSVDLQLLLNQMNPIILREVNKWSAAMSRSLLETEAKRLAVEAFKAYDPNKGVALSTFLASRLPKLSRLVYSNQNVARLSETKTLLFNAYNTAHNDLYNQHGRDPTNEELADSLGWSKRKLEQFQRQAHRKEYVESEDHPYSENGEDYLVDFIYHGLTPLQQSIFEHSSGYMGKPKLSGKQMMAKLKITQGQLSYQKNLITKAVENATHGR